MAQDGKTQTKEQEKGKQPASESGKDAVANTKAKDVKDGKDNKDAKGLAPGTIKSIEKVLLNTYISRRGTYGRGQEAER